MVDTLYIEREVAEHKITQRVLKRYPNAQQVSIEQYGEVFNPAAQNFRSQKRNPALILARKTGQRIMPAPEEYEIGGDQNYYFSHMLNCVYDCRYCFLQGMYRSANYLLFVNYDEFADDLIEHVATNGATEPWYFSGYDCDSLAFEPVTGFAEYFLDVFARKDMARSTLELRTKSTQIRSLERRQAMSNVVVAFSLNPQSVVADVEKGTPSLDKRIKAIQRLQQAGWRIGLRFDPIVWHDDFERDYREFFARVFAELDSAKIDSITLGAVRLPKTFHKNMVKLFPEHWLFKAGMTQREQGMVGYQSSLEERLLEICQQQIAEHYKHPVHSYPIASVSE